jgi:ABC-2 type transport system ATP-binding protein
MDAPAIATQHLTRRFGDLIAVQDVNLSVASGQFFGFLGPNGAGKSTTIKMLTGLLSASSGSIQILGLDLAQNPVEVKRQIGVVPEGMALFGRLTGAEYLNFVGRMYGLDRETAGKRTAELLDFMQLADQPKALVTDYSHGMQKKLALAAAVIHGPRILFLDEPFEGVDAIASGTLKAMLQRMIARGATIFLTSHVLEIVERLCSHLAIIHRGRLVAQGSLEELRAGVEAHSRRNFSSHRRWHTPRRPGTFMAGLTSSPEMRGQLAAIARVRWQLFVNGLRTIRGRLEVVARGIIFLMLTIAGLGGSFALGVAAWYFVSQGKVEWIAILLWPIFLFWQLFPVMASAFTENVDSSNLLRFPLSFPSYFLIRLVYGSLDPSTIIGSMWLIGVNLGIGIARPGLFFWAALVLLVFGMFNVLFARMIFSWIERWLAQRRTREIMGAVFFVFIICFQFIGPLATRYSERRHPDASRNASKITAQVLRYERAFPPGLAATGISGGFHGAFVPALGAFAVSCVYALAILGLLNVRLRAQYHGENLSEAAARRSSPKEKSALRLSWNVSGIPGPMAAVLEKEVHYLSRSGPMLFTFVMPVIILLIFRLGPAGTPGRHSDFLSHAPDLAFPVGAAYALLILTNLVYNCFGADAVGMQFYYVSPVRFREILMGKNLTHALLLASEVILVWLAVCFMFRPPALDITLATVAGVAFAILLNLTAGNLLSLYTPKKIDYGTFGKQRASTTTVFASLGIQAVVFGLTAITLLIARLYGRIWLAAVIFLILAGLAAIAYTFVLKRVDRIALDRRDAILVELCRV